MKDVVLILHAESIADAKALGAQLERYDTYLFDPVLSDYAADAALQNVKLFTDPGGPSYRDLDIDAHASARTLETLLDQAQLPVTGVSIWGWQHLNLYYLWMTLSWYRGLWDRMAPRLKEDRYHVLINDNPANYYFNSFLPSVALAWRLKSAGVACIAYDYGARGSVTLTVPALEGIATDAGALLTHVPTCIYDKEYLRDEINAAGTRTVNLESPLWHVPLAADRQIGLVSVESVYAGLEPVLRQRVDSQSRVLREVLGRELEPHIAPEPYRVRQVDHIVERYRCQFITWLELHRHFEPALPARLLLSEHDTGYHGPLISFAERHSLPVVLVPHSKVFADIEFTHDRITALTHPIQGRPIHDGKGRPVPTGTLCFPERLTEPGAAPGELRTLSLLLNSLSLNGIPFAPTEIYMDGIRCILAWCSRNDVAVKMRCKPGYTLGTLFRAALGIDRATLDRAARESMENHAKGCDACVMYDMPTTAALYFLRNGTPVLNPLVTPQSETNQAIVHPDVVPPQRIEDSLRQLDLFKSQPLALQAFRAAQFHAYASRFDDARALRTYL